MRISHDSPVKAKAFLMTCKIFKLTPAIVLIFCHRVDEVYHVSVMPCYDKKLEAVRDDFVFQLDSPNDAQLDEVRLAEVDSVLTSGEVLDLIKLKAVDFGSLEESPLDKM